MKKLISMLLAAAMLAATLAGCGSTLEEDEKGAEIAVYLGTEILDFDPSLAYIDDNMSKLFGLVYEGLTRIDSKGKVVGALMESYEIVEDEDEGEYTLEISLNDSKWSDGRLVQAEDIVFAWKRILDPEFESPAAPLLFDIKNARAVKSGDCSIDDLGVAAADTDLLIVEFEGPVDYELFLENCACPALVPLREDIVTRYENFGMTTSTFVCNGPFAIKGLKAGEELLVERNVYYRRDTNKNDPDPLDKYVLPYRLRVNMTMDEEAQMAAFEAGTVYYVGNIPLSKRAAYAETATMTDLLSTTVFQFDCTHKLFKDPAVRKDMSNALDRTAIANAVVYADPATGFIAPTVNDKAVGDSFRANGGDLLSKTAASAGSHSGNFVLSYRDTPEQTVIAEHAKEKWEAMGFSVKLLPLNATEFKNAYAKDDYDVILVDFQMQSTDAFATLAPFALAFGGGSIDIQNDNYDLVPFMAGYNNDAYNELMETIFAEKDRAARSVMLHDAEKMLVEDMPIIPVIFNKDAYVFNEEVLSGIKDFAFGIRDFRRLNMKDWRSYQTTAAPAEDAAAAQ